MQSQALSETTLFESLVVGASGLAVRRVQEWLTLNRIGVVIDGEFGAATQSAVRAFQQNAGIAATGVVDSGTFSALVSPMTAAIGPTDQTASLGTDICRCAAQHAGQHPREIGGENRGPWVRLYMRGSEGQDEPWCAGFATFVIAQAAGDRPLPFVPSTSCDQVAANARDRGLFRNGDQVSHTNVVPGSLFLVRRATGSGWHHTGIVVGVTGESLITIEGNTNDDGSREGYEAVQRYRALGGLDFVVPPS